MKQLRIILLIALVFISGGKIMAKEPVLAFTVDLLAGTDVYFRTADWQAYPEEIVPILARNYHANTLYVIYAGQLPEKQTIEAFKRWQDAAIKDGVEIIPVLSMVNSFLGLTRPELISGTIDKAGIGPMVDIKNPEVLAYYHNLAQAIDNELKPKVFGVMEFNDYSIAMASDSYKRYKSDELKHWWQNISEAVSGKPALTFMQPYGVKLKWLQGIERVSVDTYTFLWQEEWSELRAYIRDCVQYYPEVDADLVILDDFGGKIIGARQKTAYKIMIEEGVTGLNLDLIITAAVARDQKGEDFWLDLLTDGSYDGFYAEGMEAVKEIYKEFRFKGCD